MRCWGDVREAVSEALIPPSHLSNSSVSQISALLQPPTAYFSSLRRLSVSTSHILTVCDLPTLASLYTVSLHLRPLCLAPLLTSKPDPAPLALVGPGLWRWHPPAWGMGHGRCWRGGLFLEAQGKSHPPWAPRETRVPVTCRPGRQLRVRRARRGSPGARLCLCRPPRLIR